MTNRLALVIGLIVFGLILADLILRSGAELLFLGRKFFDFLDWIAFWR